MAGSFYYQSVGLKLIHLFLCCGEEQITLISFFDLCQQSS